MIRRLSAVVAKLVAGKERESFFAAEIANRSLPASARKCRANIPRLPGFFIEVLRLAYFENSSPGSFGLPFFNEKRKSFLSLIVTEPSIFWPS